MLLVLLRKHTGVLKLPGETLRGLVRQQKLSRRAAIKMVQEVYSAKVCF